MVHYPKSDRLFFPLKMHFILIDKDGRIIRLKFFKLFYILYAPAHFALPCWEMFEDEPGKNPNCGAVFDISGHLTLLHIFSLYMQIKMAHPNVLRYDGVNPLNTRLTISTLCRYLASDVEWTICCPSASSGAGFVLYFLAGMVNTPLHLARKYSIIP